MLDLISAWVVVVVKKKQDVLQGISKLDYLLKVSVFQVYKDQFGADQDKLSASIVSSNRDEISFTSADYPRELSVNSVIN